MPEKDVADSVFADVSSFVKQIEHLDCGIQRSKTEGDPWSVLILDGLTKQIVSRLLVGKNSIKFVDAFNPSKNKDIHHGDVQASLIALKQSAIRYTNKSR